MHPMIFATFNFYRKSLLRFPEGKLNGMKGYYYITIKLEKLRKSHFLIRCNSKLDIQEKTGYWLKMVLTVLPTLEISLRSGNTDFEHTLKNWKSLQLFSTLPHLLEHLEMKVGEVCHIRKS